MSMDGVTVCPKCGHHVFRLNNVDIGKDPNKCDWCNADLPEEKGPTAPSPTNEWNRGFFFGLFIGMFAIAMIVVIVL